MFYKVLRRDPLLRFLEDEDDDFFSDGSRWLSDLTSPLTVSPLGILTIGETCPTNKRVKENLKKSVKRKRNCTCECTCASEDHEEKQKSVTNPSTTSDTVQLPPTKKSRFEVSLNLDKRYKPGELKVKLSGDNRSLIVEGCHEEKHESENGFSQVCTQVYRRIPIPENVDVEGLKCDMNEKGVMVISAPRILPAIEDGEKVREIPISLCSNSDVAQGEKTTVEGASPENITVAEKPENVDSTN